MPQRDLIGFAVFGTVDLAGEMPFGVRRKSHDQLMAQKRTGAFGDIRITDVRDRVSLGRSLGSFIQTRKPQICFTLDAAALDPNACAAILREPGGRLDR